jgi:DNA-binding NarL/FixJ family response regulator
MTTSDVDHDISQSYDLGANSYITKPVTFDGLVKVVQNINHYWLEIVTLSIEPSG